MSFFEDFFAGFTRSMSTAPPGAKIVVDNTFTGSLGLVDVTPDDQQGQWKLDYDKSLYRASESTDVPFAVLKAHAIRESALKAAAYRLEPTGKASYGLMQILWWKNSGRFTKWGYSDDDIGDGSLLYDANVNCFLGAKIWRDNWDRMQNLRDTINAYNTGVVESKRVAPGNYVNDVLKYYSEIVGGNVL